MTEIALLELRSDGFHPVDATDVASPHVADSFLAVDGSVRELERHVERFARSVRALHDVTVSDHLLPAVRRVLPENGDLFPRIEFVPDSGVFLRLRTAPPRGLAVRFWIDAAAEQRSHPQHKGPDLTANLQSAARAKAAGGDDALWIDDRTGAVLEGSTTSLLWWEGDDLCAVPRSLPVLPSVTVAIIEDNAARHGISFHRRARTLTDLAHCEVWAVNALHGIRPVTEVLNADVAFSDAMKFRQYGDVLLDQAVQ